MDKKKVVLDDSKIPMIEKEKKLPVKKEKPKKGPKTGK